MKEILDLIFVGGGPSTLFCASKLDNKINFLILEQGKNLEKRNKSIRNNSSEAKSDILFGVGGAGLFSDGKLNFCTDIGGNPLDVLSQGRINKITKEFFDKYSITPLKAGNSNVKIDKGKNLVFPQYHFGSDRLRAFILKLIRPFEDRIVTNCIVKKIEKEKELFVVYVNGAKYKSKKVIIATGQSHFDFPTEVAKSFGITITPAKISIGFRVEAKMDNLQKYFDIQYDPKILFETKYGQVRTFCSNPGGHVVSEEKFGFSTANGHANYENKTIYGNFALLLKIYGKERIIDGCKKLSQDTNSKLIVENVVDFLNGKHSRKLQIKPQHNNYVTGLKFEKYFPSEVFEGLKEALWSLIKIEPGLTKSILYAPELKVLHYTLNVRKNSFESVEVPSLYFIGDSNGNIHGLWNAIMSGISCAEELKNEK